MVTSSSEFACDAGDLGSIPEWGRSPGKENGNPLQYSCLKNPMDRDAIAFLPRSKRLLISWPQSPPAVILEPKKIKSDAVSIVFPSICHEVMGPDAMILVF